MKVERQELSPVQAQKQTHKGAVAGDKVIFSPHNPINQEDGGYLWDCGITPNKVYVINDDLKFINDDGRIGQAGTAAQFIGEFDIVEKAPRITPVQPFAPVHLILESVEDVKRIAEDFEHNIQF